MRGTTPAQAPRAPRAPPDRQERKPPRARTSSPTHHRRVHRKRTPRSSRHHPQARGSQCPSLPKTGSPTHKAPSPSPNEREISSRHSAVRRSRPVHRPVHRYLRRKRGRTITPYFQPRPTPRSAVQTDLPPRGLQEFKCVQWAACSPPGMARRWADRACLCTLLCGRWHLVPGHGSWAIPWARGFDAGEMGTVGATDGLPLGADRRGGGERRLGPALWVSPDLEGAWARG